MPRPHKLRLINKPPLYTKFKPVRIERKYVEQTSLLLDEFEAFRLADYLGMSHSLAANQMQISRSTFTRLINQSRKKIAELIIHGKMLVIEGGNIHFKYNIIRCYDCGNSFQLEINNLYSKCPNCQSTNLLNLARSFGHGECCKNHSN